MGCGHQGLGVFPPREVAQGNLAGTAELADRCLHPLRRLGHHIANDDGRAFLGETACRGRADTLSAAGDDRDLAFKPTGAGRFGVQYGGHWFRAPIKWEYSATSEDSVITGDGIAIPQTRVFGFEFIDAAPKLFNEFRLVRRPTPVAFQESSQRGNGSRQCGHHLMVPTVRLGPFFSARPLRLCPILSAGTATVSLVKIIGQQLRNSQDGEHDSDIRRALEVL